MLRFCCALVPLTTLLTVSFVSPSQAFERQWHVGGGLGAGAFSRPNANGFGPTAEIAGTYGLTDEFNLLVEASWATYGAPLGPSANQVAWLHGNVGIAYTLDVLRWVPYAGLLVGGARVAEGAGWSGALQGNSRHDAYLDLVAAGGLDYQITRDLAVGGALRFHTLVAASPSYAFVGTLRAQYTWGFLTTRSICAAPKPNLIKPKPFVVRRRNRPTPRSNRPPIPALQS